MHREELFQYINSLPTCFEVVSGKVSANPRGEEVKRPLQGAAGGGLAKKPKQVKPVHHESRPFHARHADIIPVKDLSKGSQAATTKVRFLTATLWVVLRAGWAPGQEQARRGRL